MRDIDAVACDLSPIHVDREVGLSEELFDAHVFDAGDAVHDALHLLRKFAQLIQFLPDDLDGRFRSHAG